MHIGNKGRDVCIWLFLVLGILTVATRSLEMHALACVAAAGICYYQLLRVPLSKRWSRRMGLRVVVLVPLNVSWAMLLTGFRIHARPRRAWEVHIVGARKETFLADVDADLALVERRFPGCLFLWETSAPIPARVRALIRRAEKEGRGFWRRGGWPIPRPPGTSRELVKEHVRHGALYLPDESEVLA